MSSTTTPAAPTNTSQAAAAPVDQVPAMPAPAAAPAAPAPVTTTADNPPAPAPVATAPPKPADPASATPQTNSDVNYDLKVPEGVSMGKEQLDKIASYAKESGMSQEQAQKLVETQASALKDQQTQLANEYQETVKTWQDAVQNDKEFGGEKFKENQELSFRAIEKFGGPTMLKLMKESGYEFHPEVFKTFARIGKAMAEDKIDTSNSRVSGSTLKTHARKLYDHPTSKKE